MNSMMEQVVGASNSFFELYRQYFKTSSDLAKMTIPKLFHWGENKSLESKGSDKMALIPYCWLVAPFDTKAWPKLGFTVRYNYHLSNLFISAVSNIERARVGQKLDDKERKYLHLVCSFWVGWSATAIEHMKDPAFCYIRHRYRQIKDLTPVLDNITYVELVAWMPRSISIDMATHLLLASSDRYYVYLVEFDELLDAGPTLKDVYEGLRQVQWVATLHGCPWEAVEPFETWEVDHFLYFPDYDHFDRTLLWEIVPFVPHEAGPEIALNI